MEIFVIARGRELEHQLLRLKMERKQGRRINIVTAQRTVVLEKVPSEGS